MTEENSRPELDHDSVDASPEPASDSLAPSSNGVVRNAGGPGEPAAEGESAHDAAQDATDSSGELHAESVAPEPVESSAVEPEAEAAPSAEPVESNLFESNISEPNISVQNDAEPTLLPPPGDDSELLPVPAETSAPGEFGPVTLPSPEDERQMWLSGVDPGQYRASSTTEPLAGAGLEGLQHAPEGEGGVAVQTVVEEEEDEDREPQRSTLAEWTITIILLLFLTTTLVQAYVIPTGSMEDTLLVGDHLLVDKLAYAPPGSISQYFLPYTDVKRGDIIVFRYPVDISQTFVKRCIGVPGDHIRIVDQQVYVNGERLNEPYTYHKATYSDTYRDNFPSEPNGPLEAGAIEMLETDVVDGEVVVPEGHYFALGDNRDFSLDSRYWGFVPRENIIGKPLIIYWSYDAPTDQLNSSSISLDHLIDLSRNFFGKTRWNRTFQLIHGYPLE